MKPHGAKTAMEQILETPKEYCKLPSDTWGVAILVVLKDLADMTAGQADSSQVVRFGFGIGALMMNLLMQLAILVWVQMYVVSTSVRKMQENYKAYHEGTFGQDGSFHKSQWDDFALRPDLCDAALSNFLFLWFICFLWAARMLQEFRSVTRLHTKIHALPRLPVGESVAEMIHERVCEHGDEHYDIVALTRGARVSLYVLAIIPKLLIAMFLFWIGMRWLTSTDSFGDLIMNALALEFVLNIDELFFNSFFPEKEHSSVGLTQWATATTQKSQEENDRETMYEYLVCLLQTIFVVSFVYLYLVKLQDILPEYGWDINHCRAFIAENFAPMCPPGRLDCFPKGGGDGNNTVAPVHGMSPGGKHHTPGLDGHSVHGVGHAL